MTLDEFEEQVIQACMQSPAVTSVLVSGSGVTWVRIRAYLGDGSFLEAYFNERRGRTAYAWISVNKRKFGADNTGGWHWHPIDDPESHVEASEAVSFDEFLSRVEAQTS